MSAAILWGVKSVGEAAATSGLFGSAGVFSIGQTLSTLGLGATALGAISAGQGQNAAARMNARMYEQQAEAERRKGERDAYLIEREAKRDAHLLRKDKQREQGTRRALMGASGAAMQGTPVRILEGAEYLGEMDAQEVMTGGRMRADNALLSGGQSAAASRQRARRERLTGRNAAVEGWLSGGGTLMSYGPKIFN